MATFDLWMVFILAGLGTYLIRLSFIEILHRFELSQTFKRALSYVPPAILSALVAPALFFHKQDGSAVLDWRQIIAGMIAFWFAWKTRSVFWTLVSGMLAYFAFLFLTPYVLALFE